MRSALQARGWLSPARGDSMQSNTSPSQSAVATKAAALHPPIEIEWPASGVPDAWTTDTPTTVGALVARGEVLVYPFVRTAHVPDAISARGRAIAWWSDGEVAAIEVAAATACTRHVGVNVPPSSDVLQGQASRALLLALTGPCGGELDPKRIPDAKLRTLEGTGTSAPASAFKSTAAARTPWAALLLAVALMLLILEWILRDRENRMDAVGAQSDDSLRKVA